MMGSKNYVYWTRAGLPGIAVMYGKDDEEFGSDYIVGGVSGHVDHAGEFYPIYKNERLPVCFSLVDAQVAVEKAHGFDRTEGAAK